MSLKRFIIATTAIVLCDVFASVLPAQRQQGRSGTPPDVVYYNAKVVTVDDQFSYAQAVAIAGDKFTAVGTNDSLRALAGPNTKLVDLRGMTVIPGLTDNHLHNAGGGSGVDLSRTRSVDEVLKAVGDRVKRAEPGEVVLSNSDWHEAQLKEQRLPLRRDLDRVAPMTPVVMVRGGHEYVLNSAALAKWNITKTTAQPQGGRITRYADGELNGELVDTAKSLVTLPAETTRTLEQRIQDQIAEYNKLHAVGLTAVRHPGDSLDNYRMRKEMERRGVLTMRVTQLLRLAGTPAAIEQTLKSSGLSPDDGDALLRLGGMKMAVDGGFEGGFMREPYEEPYGEGGTFRGLQTMPQDRFNEAVKLYNRLGWRVFTHAVGDAAIDEVLAGYEAANAERSINGRRWGIEHAFIGRRDHLPRMKNLGLLLSLQDHLYLAGPSLVNYWGRQRAFLTTPVKMYLDAGLPVSGGTDSSVVPYSPLWVVYHFVTRDTISGGPMGADQKISREDALRMVTRNHWYLTFEENTKGIIAPGRFADMVVLPEDIMTVPAKRIEQMRVMMTMVGGKVVYRDADFRTIATD
ncbi:MAG TPA: amidohydrolase [Vicinamibacterales bacterium]|nr:amidohydrolase [Vicinamibacterales bacterium]